MIPRITPEELTMPRPVPCRVTAVLLCLAMAGSFGAGLWFGRPAHVDVPADDALPDAVADVRPGDRRGEPRALEARTAAVRRDAAAIAAACQRAGGWNSWQRNTARYRTALKARIDALKPYPELLPHYTLNPFGLVKLALDGRDGFPLFEVDAVHYLNFLYDPATVEAFRRARPAVAADRWLCARGIDLIFVAVPKMTEVYVEHFLDPCPKDGVIAPHLRHTLHDLLSEDVEVVDGFALFRPVRAPAPDYLYNSGEAHWAPRGMRVMAKEIAERIQRYEFGTRARYALPAVHSTIGSYKPPDPPFLSPDQIMITNPIKATTQIEVCNWDGTAVADDPSSPVLLIGNSYAKIFREQLVREMNLRVRSRISDAQTTEAFGDFLREPDLLAGVRVVVWIASEQFFTRFQSLPGPISDCLTQPLPEPDMGLQERSRPKPSAAVTGPDS
jgi:hypothetical protein